jgi:hypothetical protein
VGKRHTPVSGAPRPSSRAGFSLIEVAILAILLLVAIGGLSGAVLSSMRLARTTEESALADEGVRTLAAAMQDTVFDQIFRRYNASILDDPVGGAPGATFDVPGLAPRSEDPDGRVGRIVFPAVDLGGGAQALREDVIEPRLGMVAGVNTDLNGNGSFADDVTNDYVLLPVRLIVEWAGAGGDRSYELDLVLGQ